MTSILRRSPFSANPTVGLRGQEAQRRILDAALQVFGEAGYHQCGIVRIAEVAGCSRASFYQYFSSKEDVFRHLAGQVARELVASADALDEVTADEAGWDRLRAWVERHAAIYLRYEPVFEAFRDAAESDDAVASGSTRNLERQAAMIRSRVSASTLPPEQTDAVIELMLNVMTRTPRTSEILRTAVPNRSVQRERVNTAMTDLVHRTLFGLDADVNVRPAPRRRAARAKLGTSVLAGSIDDGTGLTTGGRRTRAALIEAAQRVLGERGYHATRVDDITEAAGVSHGAFYRYFDNKDHVVRLLALRAMHRMSSAFDEIPDVAGHPGPASSAQLTEWLDRYVSTSAAEAAIVRVWVDATVDDPTLGLESAAALDWGRARLVRFLQPRAFGDIESEALLMVVLLDVTGRRRHFPDAVSASRLIIERGLLGFEA